MRGASNAKLMRYGVMGIVLLLLVMAASFNLSKMPGLRGQTYYAEFADASGLRVGNIVQVGGIRVGRVDGLSLAGNKVLVEFEVDPGVEFGTASAASVEVLNLLGEKYLKLTPAGSDQLAAKGTIPLARTTAAYDIVGVLGQLTDTTEQIDTKTLENAFHTLAQTMDSAGPELPAALTGISRLSRSISTRDQQLRSLLTSSRGVSTLLADRSQDVVDLMGSSQLVFAELQRRKKSIHRLLVSTRSLARQLRGLAQDNQAQIQPALTQVNTLLGTLVSKETELKATLNAFGPYATILGNIVGTGPWFDAYAVNLAGLPTGEFVPGGI